VTPADTTWHFTTALDLFDHWQTVIAGVLAFVAGFGTVAVTMIIARRQIAASREDADRVIAATREQTETTVRLERTRVLTEDGAFHAMLEAAMARVLAEADLAKKTYPQGLATGAFDENVLVRQCITKGAFAELRAACITQGGPLTSDFLDLERMIDRFASSSQPHAALSEQLALIEANATKLRQKAAERI